MKRYCVRIVLRVFVFAVIVLLLAQVSCRDSVKSETSSRGEFLIFQYAYIVSWPPSLDEELISLAQAEEREDYDFLSQGYMALLDRPEIRNAANSNELRGDIFFSLAEASYSNPRGKDILACISYLNLAWNCEAEQIQEASAKLLIAIFESEEYDMLADLWRKQLNELKKSEK